MSRDLTPFVVYGFGSVHDTLEAESVVRAAAVPAVTVPSPHELGEVCGIALRVAPEDAPATEAALLTAGTPFVERADVLDF
jgi:hypothetical protein